MKIKKLIPLLLILILSFGIVLSGGINIKPLHLIGSSGSGGIINNVAGICTLGIDTTTGDSSFASFTMAGTITEGMKILQGYFFIDYMQDSTDYVDTIVVRLMTAMINDNAALAYTLQTDTIDTSDYIYYSYASNDTLFKNYTWFEFDVWDSTSDSAGTGETRFFRASSGINAYE